MKKSKSLVSESCGLTSAGLIKAYYIMFAVSAILSFSMMFFTDGESFANMLFHVYPDSHDNFMDFFNSIRDASTKNVYKEGIIYPPLANMLFYIISKMIRPALASTDFNMRLQLQRDTTCIFIYFVFVFLCLLILIKLVQLQLMKNGMPKFSHGLPLVLVFSFPIIYCVQRGNIALLSLVFSMFFVYYRNSENKWVRELSFILLAVAAGLKLYPALFGLLLLTDKQFKRAARLVLYGVICLVLPFFFYDGFESIGDIITNLGTFSDDSLAGLSPAFVSIDVISMYVYLNFGVDFNSLNSFLLALTYAAAIIMFIILKEEWQKVFCVAFMIMNYMPTGRTYILVLMLIPFILFITKKAFRKRDVVYFIGFSLLLLVIPTLYYNHIDAVSGLAVEIFGFEGYAEWLLYYLDRPNLIISVFVVQGMMVFMFFDMLVRISRNEVLVFNKRKSHNKAELEKASE